MSIADTQAEIEQFVTRLEALDRAELARLKRSAGRRFEECGSIYPLFYRTLPPGIRGREARERACFLVATLFPSAPGKHAGDLGHSMSLLRSRDQAGVDGVDRRMSVLLDCSFETLPFRLRQVVRLLGSKEIGIDWRVLLQDVIAWDYEWRPTQKKWARSYFGTAATSASADTPDTDSGADEATGEDEEDQDAR